MLRAKKVLIILAVVVAVLGAVLAVGVLTVDRYLNSTGFVRRLQEEVRRRAGIDLAIGSVRVGLPSGITVRDLKIASASAPEPPVEIGEIAVKFRPGDLLRKNLTVEEITISRPQVRLMRDTRGKWNFPSVESGRVEKAFPRGGRRKKPKADQGLFSGWEATFSAIRLREGRFELASSAGRDPLVVEGISADVTVLPRPGSETAFPGALLRLVSVRWGGRVMLEDLFASLRIGPMEPSTGNVAWDLEARGKAPPPGRSRETEDSGSPEAGREDLRLTLAGVGRDRGFEITKAEGTFLGANFTGRLNAEFSEESRAVRLDGDAAVTGLEMGEIITRVSGNPVSPVGGVVGAEFTVTGSVSPGLRLLPRLEGRINSPAVSIGGLGTLNNLEIPLKTEGDRLRSERIKALLAGGRVEGEAAAALPVHSGFGYRSRLLIENVDLALLKIDPSAVVSGQEVACTGRLNGRVEIAGDSFRLPGLRSHGMLTVRDGSISGHHLPEYLADLMNQEWMRRFEFDRAEAIFSLHQGILSLNSFKLVSPHLRLASTGAVELLRGNYLNLKLALEIPEAVVDALRPPALRYSFNPLGADPGFFNLEFRLWGPPGNLETDLHEVMLKNALRGALQKFSAPQ